MGAGPCRGGSRTRRPGTRPAPLSDLAASPFRTSDGRSRALFANWPRSPAGHYEVRLELDGVLRSPNDVDARAEKDLAPSLCVAASTAANGAALVSWRSTSSAREGSLGSNCCHPARARCPFSCSASAARLKGPEVGQALVKHSSESRAIHIESSPPKRPGSLDIKRGACIPRALPEPCSSPTTSGAISYPFVCRRCASSTRRTYSRTG